MKALLCHPQTQHSKKLAEILYINNELYKFVNPSRISKENADKLPEYIRGKLESRIIDLPASIVENNFPLELYRLFQQKILKKKGREFYYNYREEYQKSIKNKHILASDAVISYDSSSWILGKRIKELGRPFLLERTIAHHNYSIGNFNIASQKYPDWSSYYAREKVDQKYISLENQELELADYVVAGSSFVKQSLIAEGVLDTKIIVNPYGVGLDGLTHCVNKKHDHLTFLFLGTISARKGMPTLLKAWQQLSPKDAKLIIAGFGDLPQNIVLPKNVDFIGAIHPDKRNELFAAADVFVFPSLLEGMAQVLVEAAVCGLPIIATETSGAAEIVEEGINGFVIKANDENALMERMDYFIKNPEKASAMGSALIDNIRNKFSMEAYGQRWSKILSTV